MKKIIKVLVLLSVLCMSTIYASSIYNAKTITIREALISIGKKYVIYIDNEEVGRVIGKPFNIVGDVFTLYDNSGKELASEKQERRILNFSINRLATIEQDGVITGYIGEEQQKDWFKVFVKSHFYNENKKLVGTYKRKLDLVMKGEFLDTKGNTDYVFKQKLISFTDIYTLTVYDNKDIPVIDAILMVCIQDAINDALKAKKSKNN